MIFIGRMSEGKKRKGEKTYGKGKGKGKGKEQEEEETGIRKIRTLQT